METFCELRTKLMAGCPWSYNRNEFLCDTWWAVSLRELGVASAKVGRNFPKEYGWFLFFVFFLVGRFCFVEIKAFCWNMLILTKFLLQKTWKKPSVLTLLEWNIVSFGWLFLKWLRFEMCYAILMYNIKQSQNQNKMLLLPPNFCLNCFAGN